MALRGLLYRKLVGNKEQADKKEGKKVEKAKESPVSVQKVSVLKRFLKRPRENDFVPAKYTSTTKRMEPKAKNLQDYQKKEFKSMKTGRMTPHRLVENKMAANSPNDNMALDLVHKQKGEMVKGRARYWGGHFLYPIGEAEKGEIMIQNGTLTFTKPGIISKSRSMNIPVKKIDWKKVGQVIKDTEYPVTCFSIPFKDDNGIIQTPVFSVDESPARENFSRFLYEKMTKKK